jgi:hypothetical protein
MMQLDANSLFSVWLVTPVHGVCTVLLTPSAAYSQWEDYGVRQDHPAAA